MESDRALETKTVLRVYGFCAGRGLWAFAGGALAWMDSGWHIRVGFMVHQGLKQITGLERNYKGKGIQQRHAKRICLILSRMFYCAG